MDPHKNDCTHERTSLQWLVKSVDCRQAIAINLWNLFLLLLVGTCSREISLWAQDTYDVAPPQAALPRNSRLAQRIGEARSLIEQGHYSDAIPYLRDVLSRDEDIYLAPNSNSPVGPGLLHTIRTTLNDLPSSARDMYLRIAASEAQRKLALAIDSGDREKLSFVFRMFPATPEAQKAAMELARGYVEQGYYDVACRYYQHAMENPASLDLQALSTVWQAICLASLDQRQKATDLLRELPLNLRHGRLKIAGKNVPWPSTPQGLLDRLRPGDPWGPSPPQTSSSGESNILPEDPRFGNPPLAFPTWQHPLHLNNRIQETLASLEQIYQEKQITAFPHITAQVVNSKVVVRSLDQLAVFDLLTEQLLWRIELTDEMISNLQRPEITTSPTRKNLRETLAMLSLEQAAWEDALRSVLVVDQNRIYTIEDLSDATTSTPRSSTSRITSPSNSLVARSLQDGSLLWQVGKGQLGSPQGIFEEDESMEIFSKTFFLSPPVAIGSDIVVVSETAGQSQLICMDGGTGNYLWSRTLASSEEGVDQDLQRRLAGALCKQARGIAVCLTGGGVVTAIDLTTRDLLWAYTYSRDMPYTPRRLQSVWLGSKLNQSTGNWQENELRIINDFVIIAPMESGSLHCVRLQDGKTAWTLSMEGGISLAATTKEDVITIREVARDNQNRSTLIEAFDVESGQPAWKEPLVLPQGIICTGHGFQQGRFVFLPVSGPAVAQIDLEEGLLHRVFELPANFYGNLTGNEDFLVFTGVSNLEVYPRVVPLAERIASALADNPEDEISLISRAQLAWQNHDIQSSVDDLVSAAAILSAKSQEDFQAKKRLGDVTMRLLDALQADFARYEHLSSRLKKWAVLSGKKTAFWKTIAAGQFQQGNVPLTLDALQELLPDGRLSRRDNEGYDNDGYDLLERENRRLRVRRSRWLTARFKEIHELTDEQSTTQLEALVLQYREKTLKANAPETWQAFLDIFGFHPMSSPVRSALASHWSAKQEWLRAVILWNIQTESTDDTVRREAYAQLALLYTHLKQWDNAVNCLRILRKRWTDTICLDGKTGEQIAADLSASGPLGALLETTNPWNSATVEVQYAPNATSTRLSRFQNLRTVRNHHAPPADDVLAYLNTSTNALLVEDAAAQLVLELSLDSSANRVTGWPLDPFRLNYVQSASPLLLLSCGYQRYYIDPYGVGAQEKARILWSLDLLAETPMVRANLGYRGSSKPKSPGGLTEIHVSDAMGNITDPGYLSLHTACYLRRNKLRAVDPLTGKPLWERAQIDSRSQISGDNQHLCVLPPGEGTALLIRIADGHLVRKTETATSANNIRLLGRRLLYQDTEGPSAAIAVRDLLTDHVLWRVEVGDDFQIIEVEGADELAVFSKTGDLILIDTLEGGISMQTRLKVSTQSGRPHILAKKDVRILAIPASSKNPPRYDLKRVPLTIRGHIPFSGKLVALESKHGALLWQKTVQHVGLALPQPSGVPILVLATNITSPITPGQPTSSSSCEFRLIDTQTGQDVAPIRPLQGRATQLILKSSITEKSRDFVLSTNWGSVRLIYPLNFD